MLLELKGLAQFSSLH